MAEAHPCKDRRNKIADEARKKHHLVEATTLRAYLFFMIL
jgi:hypothetical protein